MRLAVHWDRWQAEWLEQEHLAEALAAEAAATGWVWGCWSVGYRVVQVEKSSRGAAPSKWLPVLAAPDNPDDRCVG